MGQTVYVDLLFMINFSMDFLCFFLCAKLLERKFSLPRVLAASAIGGVYSDIALFIRLGSFASLAIDIAVCVLMCAVAFYKRGRFSSLLLSVLVYFAISMALGGTMTAIFNLLNKADLPLSDEGSDGISVWAFAILAIVSALITLIGGRFFKKRTAQKRAEVEITYNGKTKTLHGMADSGNLLREPISGRACIIADISTLSDIVPDDVLGAARKKDISAIHRFSDRDAKNVRIVPIKTAGGEGVLLALRAESVRVDSGHGETEVDALVVLSDIKENADGSEALLPSGLMI